MGHQIALGPDRFFRQRFFVVGASAQAQARGLKRQAAVVQNTPHLALEVLDEVLVLHLEDPAG